MEIFETKIWNQNIVWVLLIFVRIWCKKKRVEFRNWHFIPSRFFVQDAQGWQDRWILALWENVCLPVEAGRGQVSNYFGEVHDEVWKDGPLLVCHGSHGHKISPWNPWQKNKPCILKIERGTLTFVSQVGQNLNF